MGIATETVREPAAQRRPRSLLGIRTRKAALNQHRSPSKIRAAVVIAIGVLASAAAVVALVVRYTPLTNHALLVAAALAPYLMLGAPLSALVFILARRRALAIAAFALTIASVAVELPLFTRDFESAGGVQVRVMTANIYLGQADANSIVETANSRADILAVQELTPEAVNRLAAAGLDKTFPYHSLDAREYASGVGLWSRYPIPESKRISGYKLAMVGARLQIPGVDANPAIIVAHLPGPWPQPIDGWNEDLKKLPDTMREAANSAPGGCAMVAGDFNSTPDMQPFRDLFHDGYRDATEEAGGGIAATYPGNSWVPPVLAIDHVLTHQCNATTVDVVDLPGSDHKGLITTIEIPRRATQQ